MRKTTKAVLASAIASAVALVANATQALIPYVGDWRSTEPTEWSIAPTSVLPNWGVNFASAVAVTATLTAVLVATRRWKLATAILVILTPFAILLSSLPLYAFIRRGAPSYWYVCPSDRDAFAAPIAVTAGLVAFCIVALRGSSKVPPHRTKRLDRT